MEHFVSEWELLTSDPYILDIVKHCHIEFIDGIGPVQSIEPPQGHFSVREEMIIQSEIEKLLEMEVLREVSYTIGQFLSPIFLKKKKNGEYRLILNLKDLNKFIPYHHFKMDTFEIAVNLVTKDMLMASIDIRHAYYSIKIADEHQKYLRFRFRDKLFQFCTLPNGLAHGPLLFTFLLKPMYASLRNKGHISTGFIDDSLLGGNTVQECIDNIHDTTSLMTNLGFMINQEKSVLVPTKVIKHLGNIIDSEQMIVYLPDDKKDQIADECRKLYNSHTATIRSVARVTGLIVASFSAVEYGKLFYRNLERAKAFALKQSKGDFDAYMHISISMKQDLKWWFTNIHQQIRHLDRGNPDLVIQTDSSYLGWGLVFDGNKVGGRWTKEEKTLHINVLELKAILFALRALADKISNKHIKILSDSTTAVCYVTNFGGCKSIACNQVSKDIWLWCIEHNVWITCAHVAGKDNEADAPSRQFSDNTEWELRNDIFQKICNTWQTPSTDLFASRLNHKVQTYCSFQPDPGAAYIDAFSIDWSSFHCSYLFPPFSMINRCICKIQKDQARAVIVVPLWTTQSWFPALLRILTDHPRVIPKSKSLLSMPHLDQVHPMWRKLKLIACRVSGIPSETEAFLAEQPLFSLPHGDYQQEKNTNHQSTGGSFSVINTKFVKHLPL